jgi:hypothetical protein
MLLLEICSAKDRNVRFLKILQRYNICQQYLHNTKLIRSVSHTPDIILKIWRVFFTAVCKITNSLNHSKHMGVEVWNSKHGKNMQCKHAFRPISAGFAAI